VVVGLAITAAGCLLFTPAAALGLYWGFLLAVFVMASGVTIVQVAANPLTTAIGDPRYTHSRLTLAQAFNSLATMIGPLFGSALMLAHSRTMPDPRLVSAATLAVLRRQEAHAVQGPFVGIARRWCCWRSSASRSSASRRVRSRRRGCPSAASPPIRG